MTKSTKSHLRGLSTLLKNTLRVHELVARAMRGKYVRQRGKGKIGSFTALRNLNHTTRANKAHERAEQIRARVVCTPAESARRAWGSLYADEIRAFCQPSPAGNWPICEANAVGVAETGAEGGARSVTDEVLLYFVLPK